MTNRSANLTLAGYGFRYTQPENNAIVHALAEDKRGHYEVPFPVVFRDDSWWDASTTAARDLAKAFGPRQ